MAKFIKQSIKKSITPFEEIEKEVYSSGKFFDVWALIEKQCRLNSALTKEDCHFITIEKADFDKVWTKQILKSVSEKQSFVAEKFPNIAKMRKFELFFKQMALLVTNNQNHKHYFLKNKFCLYFL